MGVDTKGCVVTEVKDAFQVAEIVEDWWYSILGAEDKNHSPVFKANENFSRMIVRFSSFGLLKFCFKYKGEERQLNVVFGASCDLENHKDEIEGDECLWFSFGNWGSSVDLMKSLMLEFKQIGECYIDENDCDDVGYYKM